MIEKMISCVPKNRPSASELLNHIYFWSNEKKLKLVQDLSDKLEFNSQHN